MSRENLIFLLNFRPSFNSFYEYGQFQLSYCFLSEPEGQKHTESQTVDSPREQFKQSDRELVAVLCIEHIMIYT